MQEYNKVLDYYVIWSCLFYCNTMVSCRIVAAFRYTREPGDETGFQTFGWRHNDVGVLKKSIYPGFLFHVHPYGIMNFLSCTEQHYCLWPTSLIVSGSGMRDDCFLLLYGNKKSCTLYLVSCGVT